MDFFFHTIELSHPLYFIPQYPFIPTIFPYNIFCIFYTNKTRQTVSDLPHLLIVTCINWIILLSYFL